jgi:hypothetical protein
MTTRVIRQLELPDGAPICFVLDRSASMRTRDCPRSATRWAYAIEALKPAIKAAIDGGHPCTLLTYGRDVETHEHVQPAQLDNLLWGDLAACMGQALGEALYYAPRILDGGVVVIGRGPSADTKVGAALMRDQPMFAALTERAYFLTVGTVGPGLRTFAELWRNAARLEDLCEPPETSVLPREPHPSTYMVDLGHADTLPPPAEATDP